eukprot:365850-Chlamydomonas_euryale.AAC.3
MLLGAAVDACPAVAEAAFDVLLPATLEWAWESDVVAMSLLPRVRMQHVATGTKLRVWHGKGGRQRVWCGKGRG